MVYQFRLCTWIYINNGLKTNVTQILTRLWTKIAKRSKSFCRYSNEYLYELENRQPFSYIHQSYKLTYYQIFDKNGCSIFNNRNVFIADVVNSIYRLYKSNVCCLLTLNADVNMRYGGLGTLVFKAWERWKMIMLMPSVRLY